VKNPHKGVRLTSSLHSNRVRLRTFKRHDSGTATL
jgi:hypothetical protein